MNTVKTVVWNYYKDEPNSPVADNHNADSITNSTSFKYKSSITGKIVLNRSTKKVEFAVPLKHLSNFWRTLDVPSINCKVSLTLTWSDNCVLTDMITHVVVYVQGNTPEIPPIAAPTGATFNNRHKIVCSSSYFIS